MTDKQFILGIGAANYDIHAKTARDYVPGDSNPADFICSAGGVTRNICENIARLGLSCGIITAVGTDVFGSAVLSSCEEAGIDISGVYKSSEHPSSSYIDLLCGNGEVFVAACNCDVLETMPCSELIARSSIISSADGIVLDTNLMPAQIECVLGLAGNIPVYCDPVSGAKAPRISDYLSGIALIKPNRLELEILSGISCNNDSDIERACEKLLLRGVGGVAVTLGKDGCYYSDKSGKKCFKRGTKGIAVINSSGAGDAFFSGLIFGITKHYNIDDALSLAIRCGEAAVMSEKTINKNIKALL